MPRGQLLFRDNHSPLTCSLCFHADSEFSSNLVVAALSSWRAYWLSPFHLFCLQLRMGGSSKELATRRCGAGRLLCCELGGYTAVAGRWDFGQVEGNASVVDDPISGDHLPHAALRGAVSTGSSLFTASLSFGPLLSWLLQ